MIGLARMHWIYEGPDHYAALVKITVRWMWKCDKKSGKLELEYNDGQIISSGVG